MRSRIMRFVIFYLIWDAVAMIIFFSQVSKISVDNLGILPVLIIGLVIVMFIPWIFFWVSMSRVPAWRKDVLENGKQAPATLIGMNDTGVSFGRTSFVVQLRLRVQPPDEAPFEATLERTLSRLEIPSMGDTYVVKYDPNNKSHMVLVSDEDIARGYATMPVGGLGTAMSFQTAGTSAGASARKDISQELANLAQMHQNGDLSDSEFEAAKRKLLG